MPRFKNTAEGVPPAHRDSVEHYRHAAGFGQGGGGAIAQALQHNGHDNRYRGINTDF
jgi:hypothetical protein